MKAKKYTKVQFTKVHNTGKFAGQSTFVEREYAPLKANKLADPKVRAVTMNQLRLNIGGRLERDVFCNDIEQYIDYLESRQSCEFCNGHQESCTGEEWR